MFRETALHTMRLQLDQYNDVKQSEVSACFISPLGPVSEDRLNFRFEVRGQIGKFQVNVLTNNLEER